MIGFKSCYGRFDGNAIHEGVKMQVGCMKYFISSFKEFSLKFSITNEFEIVVDRYEECGKGFDDCSLGFLNW